MEINIREIKDQKNIECILAEFKPYLFNKNITDEMLKQLSVKFSKAATVLTAYNNCENIGYAAFYCNNISEKRAYISMIAVKDQYGHHGIGTKLLNEVINFSENSGMEFLCLESDKKNKKANAFYKKHNFFIANETENQFFWEKKINLKEEIIKMTERDVKYAAFKEDDIKNNRGRLVNSCDEISCLLENPHICEIVSKHSLNDILTYAVTFSDYYEQYRDFKALNDFPIVNKEILKQNWDKIAVKQYENYPDNRVKYTSGSTGTPFKMVMDRYKHCRWIAANKVFRANVGVLSHEKTLFISETVSDKNIPLERMERDNVFYVDFKYLENDSLNKLINDLTDKNFRSLTALASILDKIARFVLGGNAPEFKGDMIAIFSVSETLKESTRKTVSEYFGCPVYVLYANEENGVLAVDDGSGNGYRANTADFYFEVLSMDDDTPAKDGEAGRLVITDYFNKAFPVIRYENGDIVTKKTLEDGRVYITEIIGRKTDTLYTTDGRMVHYFNSISFLEPFMDIKQFQLIQEDYHNFTWILNTENHSYEEMIIRECRELFGQDSNWKFEYVDEIPKLRSGKSRMTVCKIPDKQ